MLQSLTTARLIANYLNGRREPRENVRETVLELYQGHYPLIQYENVERVRGTCVLIHGVTPRASEDPNLVHLARCVASIGYRCLTPPLIGLSNFAHDVRDIEIVATTFKRAYVIASAPISVMAFSYGASYALSAAAVEDARSCCSSILAFGAYHSLKEALEHQRQLLIRHPDPHQDDSDVLYLRYTLLACQREELGLSLAAFRDIDETLSTFMFPGPLDDKKRALLTHASHFDYVKLMELYQRRDLPAILSPAGQLHRVACPVALLHDPNDSFVPAAHLNLLRAELDQRQGRAVTKTLETPMLSHVQVNPLVSLRDTWKFIRLLAPTFKGARPNVYRP